MTMYTYFYNVLISIAPYLIAYSCILILARVFIWDYIKQDYKKSLFKYIITIYVFIILFGVLLSSNTYKNETHNKIQLNQKHEMMIEDKASEVKEIRNLQQEVKPNLTDEYKERTEYKK